MTSLKKILREYKIGDNFIITNRPTKWSSLFNTNNPMSNNIIYPYYGRIVDMKLYAEHIAMTDGVYGWSLCTLVHENVIINLRKERREKLNKLKRIK